MKILIHNQENYKKRNIIVNENIKGIINFVEKRNYYFTTSMLLIFHG